MYSIQAISNKGSVLFISVACIPASVIFPIALAFIKFAFTFTFYSGSFAIFFITKMWVKALMAFFPAIHILECAFVAEFLTSNTFWFRLRYWLIDDIFIAKNVIEALEAFSPTVNVCGITHAHAVNFIHGTIIATIVSII